MLEPNLNFSLRRRDVLAPVPVNSGSAAENSVPTSDPITASDDFEEDRFGHLHGASKATIPQVEFSRALSAADLIRADLIKAATEALLESED